MYNKFYKITKITYFAIKFLIQNYESKRSRNLSLHLLTFPRGKNYSWLGVVFSALFPHEHIHTFLRSVLSISLSLSLSTHTLSLVYCSVLCFCFYSNIYHWPLWGAVTYSFTSFSILISENSTVQRYSSPLNNTGALT